MTVPRSISFAALALIADTFAASAEEVCTPQTHAPLGGTVDQTYDNFRATLIGDGWQPKSVRWQDRDGEEWGNIPAMLEAGFDEVVSCAGTGAAACEFRFTDVYSNTLVVITAGEVWEENPFPGVARFYFVCGE